MATVMHTLESGRQVPEDEYFKLLEWKDENFWDFRIFCDQRNSGYSINRMTEAVYNELKRKAKIE